MLRVCIKIMEDMIWLIMKIKECVKKLEKKDLVLDVLTGLKIKMKLNIVLSMNAETHTLRACRKLNFFSFFDIVRHSLSLLLLNKNCSYLRAEMI